MRSAVAARFLTFACFDRQHFPTANSVVRTESEPGGKRRRVGEAREVRTDLPQKSLCREDVDPGMSVRSTPKIRWR